MLIEAQKRRAQRCFCAFLLAFYVVWTLRVVLLLPIDAQLPEGFPRQAWSHSWRLLFWVLPPLLYIHGFDHAPGWNYLKLDRPPRRASLAAAVGIGYIAACMAVAVSFQGATFDGFTRMKSEEWIGVLAGTTIVAFAEELLFRGFVFQHLRAWQSFAFAATISSALFVAAHVPGWLYLRGAHLDLIPLAGSIFIIGLVLAYLIELTDSLWPAIGLHFVNNVVSALLFYGN